MLLRQLRQDGVAPHQHRVMHLFGAGGVDANSASAHLVHHRQQVDFEPVGAACVLAIEHRVEALKQEQCAGRVLLGIAPNVARRQLPDMGCWIELLLTLRDQPEGGTAFKQQRVILARQTAPRA